MDIYSACADRWWDKDSPEFRSLHSANIHRTNVLERHIDTRWSNLAVADLGCGGGIFSIPLANKGASVCGVDTSPQAIEAARAAAPPNAHYAVGSAASTRLNDRSFDVVLLADIVEHLENWPKLLVESHRILKPDGILFVSTINKTFRSWLLAIQLCERLKLVPPGTHSYKLLVKPKDLAKEAESAGFELVKLQGSAPMLLKTLRTWSIHLRRGWSCGVAYSGIFRKPARRR